MQVHRCVGVCVGAGVQVSSAGVQVCRSRGVQVFSCVDLVSFGSIVVDVLRLYP